MYDSSGTPECRGNDAHYGVTSSRKWAYAASSLKCGSRSRQRGTFDARGGTPREVDRPGTVNARPRRATRTAPRAYRLNTVNGPRERKESVTVNRPGDRPTTCPPSTVNSPSFMRPAAASSLIDRGGFPWFSGYCGFSALPGHRAAYRESTQTAPRNARYRDPDQGLPVRRHRQIPGFGTGAGRVPTQGSRRFLVTRPRDRARKGPISHGIPGRNFLSNSQITQKSSWTDHECSFVGGGI